MYEVYQLVIYAMRLEIVQVKQEEPQNTKKKKKKAFIIYYCHNTHIPVQVVDKSLGQRVQPAADKSNAAPDRHIIF